MLPNKIILKICKFFGFRKKEEHITDVTINYPNKITNRDDALFSDKISDEDVYLIKNFVFEEFRNNPTLEKRCSNTHQVWLTFYESTSDRSGSIMKMLYYDGSNNALFYPYDKDRKAWERNSKLKDIGI